MAVTVTPVGDKRELDAFLRVPYRIYADDPNYVFPLLGDLRKFFDKNHNPFYNHAESELWLARRGDEVVGRIGAAVDRASNEHWHEQAGYFGFYEADDDPEVAHALLAAARGWIAARGMDVMRGPGCFTSNHDWFGLQVAGAFTRPVIGMPYNPRYYEKHFEDFGLSGAQDLYAWYIETLGSFPLKMQRLIDRILARPGLVVRPFVMKEFMAEASRVRRLYNDCWSRNWGFVPMDDDDFAYAAKDMKSMVDPEFLLIAELDGEPIGFSLTIPDFNEALQPLRGRLLPFGWLKFLLRKGKVRTARTLLMGVLPEYRRLGVDVAMVHRTMQSAFARGITSGECSWVLADNAPMNRIMESYGADCYKTYRIYEMLAR
jgi:GNAT superfamily N-acetyltransferase